MSIDPETGIKPISEWGNWCAMGLRIADQGTVISGQAAVRKISHSRKQRGMASDSVQSTFNTEKELGELPNS